jgi:hypothetical protein
MKYFVPSENEFKQVSDAPTNASVNDIIAHLGLHQDTVFSFWHEPSYNESRDISFAILEVFSKNVVCVAMHDKIRSINKYELNIFLDKLEDDSIYDSYNVEAVLRKSIENRSLTSEFLTRVLKLKYTTPNGIFFSEKLDKYLFFTEGVLTDYRLSDGLDVWAKRWKQIRPDLLASQQVTASYYWGSNHRAILAEVNRQADAWANIPQAANNEFVELHRNNFGAVSFEMLQVCHYKKPMKLQDFVVANYGRCKMILSNENAYVYKCGNFSYKFDKEGNIADISLLL